MDHYKIDIENMDILPFDQRIQRQARNVDAFRVFKRNRVTILEDHEKRDYDLAKQVPFHIQMLENEEWLKQQRRQLEIDAKSLDPFQEHHEDEVSETSNIIQHFGRKPEISIEPDIELGGQSLLVKDKCKSRNDSRIPYNTNLNQRRSQAPFFSSNRGCTSNSKNRGRYMTELRSS